MASNGKIPDKLKGAGSFLMKVFGALAVYFEISGLDRTGSRDCQS